jgi:glycosyltransferase involved in cell wall biosynthesis
MNPTAPEKPLVLHAVSRMAVGGVQRVILETLARADRECFNYAVLCTKKEGRWGERVRAMGIPIFTQKTLPPWDPYQIWRLSRVIRRIRPDVVHIHMAPMVLPVASACRLVGVNHYLVHHHSEYTTYWKKLNPFMRRWEWALTRRADAIVAVSQAAAACTCEHLRLTPDRIETIYNGLDPELFKLAQPRDPRPEWGLTLGTPLVIQVSRYLPGKRIEDFIEAAALVRKRWQEEMGPLPVFVVLGSGSEKLRQGYVGLIERLDLREGVLLPGSRDDVPNILPACRVGVLASENEGFGLVVLEYLAAGLPVAATDLTSIRELVTDNCEALLSPPRNPKELASNIYRLLTDQQLRRNLTEQGKNRLDQFDWNKTRHAYEEVYNRILDRD